MVAQQSLRSILRENAGHIAGSRKVIQLLTGASLLILPLSPFLDKDEVHCRVPGIVNTDEE
jgi:hypothetical protein